MSIASKAGSSKVFADAMSALAGIVNDEMSLMAGGFGLCGIPENLIAALRDSGSDGDIQQRRRG
jgi:3-oxoacid CoA-transferase subunit A